MLIYTPEALCISIYLSIRHVINYFKFMTIRNECVTSSHAVSVCEGECVTMGYFFLILRTIELHLLILFALRVLVEEFYRICKF